jgi:serine/threonine-protein kinase
MRSPAGLGFDNTPRYAYAVAAVLALTVAYSVLQIGFVRPYLAPDVTLNLARPPAVDGVDGLLEWRSQYHAGLAGRAMWGGETGRWARAHAGMIVQIIVFTGAAILLFLLRSNDLTAGLSVLALAMSAVAGGGPLLGAEGAIPILGPVLTLFAWIAAPVAFPLIALAILYFPSKSPLLDRHPLLHALPVVAAAPLLLPALGTGLFLSGIDGAARVALWDAAHPGVFYLSFAVALLLNVAAVGEGIYRYKYNHNANERRRIRMALFTAVPGVLAYVFKDGVPMTRLLLTGTLTPPPWALSMVLQGIVLLPAFGLVYAVGVERVLGPRVVLRRSLQYALANKTLKLLPLLPLAALVITLVIHKDKTIAEVATGQSAIYVLLLGIAWALSSYRDRARLLLDQRFFREEYDARKILLGLANRVRFESHPAELAGMVLSQIDEALHPELSAILVGGVEDGRLTPVTVLRGSAEPLPLDGGLATMLRWSDQPLEIFLQDPRSPARRLPAVEQEWLHSSGAVLIVPVVGAERELLGIIALGEKRSEEAYTDEDRQLLASIAAQMGLGFDVARLRRLRHPSDGGVDSSGTHTLPATVQPMTECPKCGRCGEAGTALCPADGTAMRPVPSVPVLVDHKYRIEQLLGRGGMGAVYRSRDVRLDRLVALKVVRAELVGDPDAQRRFRREAQIIARLHHPCIVSVFDYGTFADGGAYLVMELVRGEDLRHVLQREGRLDPPRALKILAAVCGAIEAAHRQGVLHRDLKPENILLPTTDEVDAKVLDFGVAKVIVEERPERDLTGGSLLTAAGMIVGTPAYMAPEQLHGVAPDARSDVFSLGVIAFEMMTGSLPFGRGSLADLVLAHARAVQQMPDSGLPADLDAVIRAALSPDPDKRPPSAQAFGQLLASTL